MMNKIIKSLLIPTISATAVAPILFATSCAKDNPFEQTSIILSARSKEIYVGQEFKLTAHINPPTQSQEVIWSSSDSSVASVNKDGVISGNSGGDATITATWALDQSISAQCEITVKNPEVPDYEITIDPNDKQRGYEHGGDTTIAFPFNAVGKDFQKDDYLSVEIVYQETVSGIDWPAQHKIRLVDETVDVKLDDVTYISFTPTTPSRNASEYWNTVFSIAITPMRGSTILSGAVGFDNLSYISSVKSTPSMFTYEDSATYDGLAITGMTDSGLWQWCSNITIPATYNNKPITEIADNAFNGKIIGLASVIEFETDENGNSNLQRIGDYAFTDCISLFGELVLPDSLTTIGNHAFENCISLNGKLLLPDSITTLGEYAFANCSSFDGELVLSNSLTEIMQHTFDGCKSLSGELVLPGSLITIYNTAFGNCSSLNKLFIPYSVKAIATYAFYKCSSLTELEFEMKDNLCQIKHLYAYCFAYTGITMLKIPASVTIIDKHCFSNCPSLTYVEFLADSNNKVGLNDISDYAFSQTPSMTDTSGPDGSYSFKYNGTMSEWRHDVSKPFVYSWHNKAATKITCSDGSTRLDGIFTF